jgi:hypothetical protein
MYLSATQFETINAVDCRVIKECNTRLRTCGWALLRGFNTDLTVFSHLIHQFCNRLSFDPAREHSNESTQKVDAGTAAIGLHIENGNTPFPPDIVGFYSKQSAKNGSQTTLCDGVQVYQNLPKNLKQRFSNFVTVSRKLPEDLWKSYAANEHPLLNNIHEVDRTHIEDILGIFPNHRGSLNSDGSLNYELDVSMLITSQLCNKPAFANALLGPSFHYETPCYTFADGNEISQDTKAEIAHLTEQFTIEIPWQDGDIALIDNKRVMHGRRAIVDKENRELYIAMGQL